VPIKRDFF